MASRPAIKILGMKDGSAHIVLTPPGYPEMTVELGPDEVAQAMDALAIIHARHIARTVGK